MKSGPHTPITTPTVSEPPQLTIRLRLKPESLATGYVDGAWWPRSRDLAAELPGLFAGLAVRLGQIRRISYNLSEWDTVARRLDIDGHLVRLGGFRFQGADTVDLISASGGRITLLVVPPATPQASANTMCMAASGRDNTDRVSDLLASVP